MRTVFDAHLHIIDPRFPLVENQGFLTNAFTCQDYLNHVHDQLPHDTPDEEMIRLHGCGVRAIRFNVKRGGSEDISSLDYFARRVYELVGWHSELYIDSTSLTEIASTVATLPAVSIDHLGISKEGFNTLLSLVNKGVRVKATGFGRVELDVEQALRSIISVNPDALMKKFYIRMRLDGI
ncbi:putative TIM-barrel fold metal-dependent hydrolase [Paenibacillus sp. RC254]|uniref:hypothetical protein n=1 Tax=unclassified Paenibacillus TaxID=185978 RepID=UPI0024BBD87C|nr:MULTISPECIES: hypothetical protein [unclassified Paenibacillus]